MRTATASEYLLSGVYIIDHLLHSKRMPLIDDFSQGRPPRYAAVHMCEQQFLNNTPNTF